MTEVKLFDGRGDEVPIKTIEVHLCGETSLWLRLITEHDSKIDTYVFKGTV